jgi:hypothetical protein
MGAELAIQCQHPQQQLGEVLDLVGADREASAESEQPIEQLGTPSNGRLPTATFSA